MMVKTMPRRLPDNPSRIPRCPTEPGFPCALACAGGVFARFSDLYIFRGVNLGFAPFLTRELGLSAADLGLLTSFYFLGFACAQLPAGILLDRYGPRRTEAALLLLAVAGSLVFAFAPGMAGLAAGRAMIGVGVSVCLGAAIQALSMWFRCHACPC